MASSPLGKRVGPKGLCGFDSHRLRHPRHSGSVANAGLASGPYPDNAGSIPAAPTRHPQPSRSPLPSPHPPMGSQGHGGGRNPRCGAGRPASPWEGWPSVPSPSGRASGPHPDTARVRVPPGPPPNIDAPVDQRKIISMTWRRPWVRSPPGAPRRGSPGEALPCKERWAVRLRTPAPPESEVNQIRRTVAPW